MPARDAYDPTPGVLGGMQLAEQLTQGQLSELQRQKSEREMQDFLNQREAMRGGGSEPVLGMNDIVRPQYLKALWKTNPESAQELEIKLFGPEQAARRAGMIEREKLKAEAEQFPAFIAAVRGKSAAPAAAPQGAQRVAIAPDYLSDGEAPAAAPAAEAAPAPIPEAAGILPVQPQKPKPTPVSMTAAAPRAIAPNESDLSGTEETIGFSGGRPTFAMKTLSPFERRMKSEENRLKSDEAGRAEEKLGLETEADRRAARKAITDEIKLVREDYEAGKISRAEKDATIEELRQMLPGGPRARAGAAPNGAAPKDTFVPKTTEQRKIEEEARADQRVQQTEERKRYDDVGKELNTVQTPRAALASSKLDALIKQNNTGKFGQPMYGVPYLEEAAGFTSEEINQFRQGYSALVQSFIQPGTSGSVNTIAEQQALARGLGGVGATPHGNALTLLALKNSAIRSAEQPGFFREMQRRGLSVNDARDKWTQYVNESSPFVLRGDHTIEPSGQPNAKLWLKQQSNPRGAPKAAPQAAPTQNTKVIDGKTFVEASPGDWVEQ